MYIMWCNI